MPKTIAVIGGGISGLSAAYELSVLLPSTKILVFEKEKFGGKISGKLIADYPVDFGPDSFLSRRSEPFQLISELGFKNELIAPELGELYLYSDLKLLKIPESVFMGIPTDLKEIKRSGILSGQGYYRLKRDKYAKRHRAFDTSVYELVAERVGEEVLVKLVEPFVCGIFAADSKTLSSAAGAPELLAIATSKGSLISGLRPLYLKSKANSKPVFYGLKSGVFSIVQKLYEKLDSSKNTVLYLSEVTGIKRENSSYVITSHENFKVDAVILATPAPESTRLLRNVDSGIASQIGAVNVTSVSVATLAYKTSDLEGFSTLRGILVPHNQQMLSTAVTFLSNKWPQLKHPELSFVRISSGYFKDDRHAEFADDELLNRLHEEFCKMLSISVQYKFGEVTRWWDAFPQYEVNHLIRMAALRTEINDKFKGTLNITNAFLGGIGVGSRIIEARQTALNLIKSLGLK
jgi:oxygen-dependent protoporphyrinogen oxidase